MRAISLVNRLQFEFTGNVVRNAVTLGDVDNDGCNELIIGNQNGDVAIFKNRERFQTISKLNFVSCIAVGDVLNQNRNNLVIVTADGWCYIYEYPKIEIRKDLEQSADEVDGQIYSSSAAETSTSNETVKDTRRNKKTSYDKIQLVCIHIQRIPANVKNILLGDVDGNGMIEMVLGLTDRVVRSYRWHANNSKSPSPVIDTAQLPESTENLLGKFVALNKWECANQIGSITLHHSWNGEPSLLIAQPGGTFMRIKCLSEDTTSQNQHSDSSSFHSENIPGLVDYQFLGLSRMRNQNISTEILGDFKSPINSTFQKTDEMLENSKINVKGRPYAVATLDGTILLVQDEVILWAFAVDHQTFALTKLDVTGNGFDDIVVCSWDGSTYILDQEKNSVRFQLDEAVQAFNSGYYNLAVDEPPVTCLVYVTFKNTVILYYDIPLKEFTTKKFEPDLEKLSEIFLTECTNKEETLQITKNLDKRTKRDLINYLLYDFK